MKVNYFFSAAWYKSTNRMLLVPGIRHCSCN